MPDEARRYEFGAAGEDLSVIVGLRGGQVALISTGLVGSVIAIRTTPNGAGFIAGVLILLLTAAMTFWSVGGRTLAEWAPTVARWAYRRITRRDRGFSEAPLFGHDSSGVAAQRPPETVAGVRLLEVPLEDRGGSRVGIVHDRVNGRYSAVLRVGGRSFQLADTPEQERRLAAWAGVLTGLARASSPIDRIQWVECTRPESGDAVAHYLVESGRADQDHPATVSYRALIDSAGRTAPRHETYLLVSVSARSSRSVVRQAGGGDHGAVRVLLRELRSLIRQLGSAYIAVEGILTVSCLAAVLRMAFDPWSQAWPSGLTDVENGGSEPSSAWPLATESTWSRYRTSNTWHASYWIAQWPRTAVGADFLVPLLLGSDAVRRVSVTMQPISPMRAHRDVERELLKQTADDELRTRAGFLGSARRRRAQETVAQRERELADGHADYRISGYVTVSASTPDELEVRCGEIEQAASQAALMLQRLHGRQDEAFTYTLPLGRGLEGRP